MNIAITLENSRLWYDALAGIRGPDLSGMADGLEISFGYRLKNITAARFRFIVGFYSCRSSIYQTPVTKGDIEMVQELATRIGEMPPWFGHYGGHALAAAKAIGQLFPEYAEEMANIVRAVADIRFGSGPRKLEEMAIRWRNNP